MNIVTGIKIIGFAIGAGLIFWLLWILVGFIGFPPPFDHYMRVVVVVVGILVAIGFILHLMGISVWKGGDGPGPIT